MTSEKSERLGNVATTLLFENDRVKVWEMLLEPGDASDLHEHTMDYCMCIVQGSSIDADPPDAGSFSIPVKSGDVFFVPRGGVERAVNRSGERFREILVELKD